MLNAVPKGRTFKVLPYIGNPKVTVGINARIDIAFDWRDWANDSDTIIQSEYELNSSDLSLVDSAIIDNKFTVGLLEGAIKGRSYQVINTVTSANGLKDSRTFVIKCV